MWGRFAVRCDAMRCDALQRDVLRRKSEWFEKGRGGGSMGGGLGRFWIVGLWKMEEYRYSVRRRYG